MARAWPPLRLTGGVLVLAVLVWQFGTGPFADAWRVTTWGSLVAASVLTALATLANAWRWRVVSRALGIPLTTRRSVAAYYRSQFLNTVLPGGVLGDAHRGALHGRDAGDLGAGLRAAAWDRVAGQLVQGALLSVALAVPATPLRGYAPVAMVGLVGVGLLVWWVGRRRGAAGFVGRDLHQLLRAGVFTRVVCASCASAAAHVGVFAVAVHSVGVATSPALLVAIALVVFVGAAVPLNVGGWGPREGVTAGVFALAGLGSANGLTVSIVFGVLAAVGTVPGLLVLMADAVVRRRRSATRPSPRVLEEVRRG